MNSSITSFQINNLFALQSAHHPQVRAATTGQRKAKLSQLKYAIQQFESRICEALYKDLRKPAFEAMTCEILFSYTEIDYALRHLHKWRRPKKLRPLLANPLSSAKIICEPKGVCLVIAPWNYPFQLLISPLISAIAAGNSVILKPSELAPATATVIAQLIRETFPENEIAVVEGGVETASALLSLPFDHIFFTGSTQTGKIVMAEAAKNLIPVTLELGGKSPVIIDETASLEKAAAKIAWGKFLNAGQTCIAPDYVFIPAVLKEAFIQLLKQQVELAYFKEGKLQEKDYVKIISSKHFERLHGLLKDALDKGGKLEYGGTTDENGLLFYPTIVSGVEEKSLLMQEEIFGPILPVITYETHEEVIRYIRRRPKPLALYVFSTNKQHSKYLIEALSFGGGAVNEVLVHIANPKLPFGGIQGSGMGASHGYFGFKTFSHEKPVLYQSGILDLNKMVYPPYKGKEKLLKWMKKIM